MTNEASPPEKFTPVVHRILICPDPPETHVGLIEIPKAAQDAREAEKALRIGTVVSLGPGMPVKPSAGLDADPPWPVVNGRRRWPMPEGITVGSRVLYRDHAAQKITLNDEEFLVVLDTAIEAEIIDEAANG